MELLKLWIAKGKIEMEIINTDVWLASLLKVELLTTLDMSRFPLYLPHLGCSVT